MTDETTLDRSRINRFNRVCLLIAALWIFVALPVSFLIRPTYQDFSAYYFAGSVVRMQRWDLLYPQREPGSPYFIFSGFSWKPGQLELADRLGIKNLFPFFGLPWNALLFVPFAYFSFETAYTMWIGVLLLCTFGVAVLAGKSFELATGKPSRMAGMVTLVAAMSVLSYRSVRVANVSPPTALALGVVIFTLLRDGRRSDRTGAAALWIGGLIKYATIILIPLLVAMRRGKMLAWTLTAGLLTGGITLAVAGRAPFADFFATVGASFGGSTPLPANQSVWGLLLRVSGHAPLAAWLVRSTQAVQLLTLIGLLTLIFRQPLPAWRSAAKVFAAAAALVCWLLIFSPVFWEHYAMYLMPLWGWIISEATTAWKKFAAVGAVALAWLPLPALLWLHLPEPVNSMMLWSCLFVMSLSVARLRSKCGEFCHR